VIIFPTQWISCQLKSKSPIIIKTKSSSSTHRNAIFYFHKTLSLAPVWTHKHEIISFHNTLMTNLSIMYISLPCLCLISLFLFNLSKSCLFTSHICFQFRVQVTLPSNKRTGRVRPAIQTFFICMKR
jgi:hypothetical protein